MKNLSWFGLIRTILLSVVLGAASGVFATSLTSSYLSDYAIKLDEFARPLQKEDDSPKSFPASYSEASQKFVSEVLPSFATIYPKTARGLFGYVSDEAIKSGVVVTQDGWVAVHNAPVMNVSQISVDVGGQLYSTTQIVTDPVTNITFLKLQANGLPVVEFGKGFELSLGQQVFVSENTKTLLGVSVVEESWPQGIIVQSDIPTRRFVLNDKTIQPGSPLFDLNGKLVGFAEKKDMEIRLMPIEAMLPAVNALLEKKKISRPSLGVQYIDLSHGVGVHEKIKRSLRAGAYITGRPAVKKGSSAAIAGLIEGDIILSVNGINVGETRGLDELILGFKSGDEITIVFDRIGEKKTTKVVLGEFVK